MFAVKCTFKMNILSSYVDVEFAIELLLSAWYINGQISKDFCPYVKTDTDTYCSYVIVPEQESLNEILANKYVKNNVKKLKELGVDLIFEFLGMDDSKEEACNCSSSSFYILSTLFSGSAISCGDCFKIIPLYKLPKTCCSDKEEYYDIISWKRAYNYCDSLFLNCIIKDTFFVQQMLNTNSELTKEGLKICKTIQECTSVATYYFLYKYYGKNIAKEKRRKCPICKGEWFLNERLHKSFDFKCDNCKLLANMADSFD